MKWHKYENQKRYDEMVAKGLTNRYEANDGESFIMQYNDNGFIRALFEQVDLPSPANVLVIGTGTGADACILDHMGYNVTAIDIIEEAIIQAKSNAKSIDANVEFAQDDILNPKYNYGMYDIIFSSSCLQSIVTDDDRAAYYGFVLRHMNKSGKHIIMTAGYSPNKTYLEDIRDHDTGIVFSPTPENVKMDDIKIIDNKQYAPSRRHFTITQLTDELHRYEFEIVCNYSKEFGVSGALVVITRLLENHIKDRVN